MNLTKAQRRTAARLYGNLRDAGVAAHMPESRAQDLASDLGVPDADLRRLVPEVGPNVRLIDICVLAARRGVVAVHHIEREVSK